jgi:catalase
MPFEGTVFARCGRTNPTLERITERTMNEKDRNEGDAKDRDLEQERRGSEGEYLTTNHGARVSHTDDSLKAGERGPTLMEDFHFREKLTHFDHERIPERVVHARGSGAYGYFQVYESLSEYTRAGFLTDPSRKTPVFVRFSTVVGFRGSADTVRDVRGFATKFYTDEGNFDMVGNNMPVFFIQDGIKFPDLVHAIKPEPHNEVPQASAAHDTFWDFISLLPESAHMIMWVLSDRALPRSYRMMDGFGVHTFRLVNEAGKARFIKWHWRSTLGPASLVWDETQKIAGKDPDFNRKDLWEAIEKGNYPEYELCIQVLEEDQEHDFDFDILDPTKIWPESEVPLQRVGKMVLNRNPDNFFAETEQVAFHPGHVVPGIDFTNDPLLQGRLFSYIDTQLIRLGGPNFNELPVNRPVAPVHNNQRDGYGRQTINRGRTAYFPNSLGGGCPMTAGADMGGYEHYMEKVDGRKVRSRSEKFRDFFSQAHMFWKSLTPSEQKRLVEAAHFELGKVSVMVVRERMVHEFFNHIDHDLARRVAEGIGVDPPTKDEGTESRYLAPEVSVEHESRPDQIATRKVAILVAEGFNYEQVLAVREALEAKGAWPQVIARRDGELAGSGGSEIEVDLMHVTTDPVLWDAVLVPGGRKSVDTMMKQGDVLGFLDSAFRHFKPIGAMDEGVELLAGRDWNDLELSEHNGAVRSNKGVVTWQRGSQEAEGSEEEFISEFLRAVGRHRHWDRDVEHVPA